MDRIFYNMAKDCKHPYIPCMVTLYENARVFVYTINGGLPKPRTKVRGYRSQKHCGLKPVNAIAAKNIAC